MKRLLLAALIGFTGLIAAPQQTQAQVSVNINIGQQPLWGPVGYDYAQYYYIPELNVYYDVMSRLFYYPQGRRWIHAAALPPRFGHYNLFNLHKVVINQANPFRYNNRHIQQYGNYRGMRPQMVIRDARENRYFANPQHPMHNQYRNDRGPAPRQNQIAQRREEPRRMQPQPQRQPNMQQNNRPQRQEQPRMNTRTEPRNTNTRVTAPSGGNARMEAPRSGNARIEASRGGQQNHNRGNDQGARGGNHGGRR